MVFGNQIDVKFIAFLLIGPPPVLYREGGVFNNMVTSQPLRNASVFVYP